jgi:hypothetical protein
MSKMTIQKNSEKFNALSIFLINVCEYLTISQNYCQIEQNKVVKKKLSQKAGG